MMMMMMMDVRKQGFHNVLQYTNSVILCDHSKFGICVVKWL